MATRNASTSSTSEPPTAPFSEMVSRLPNESAARTSVSWLGLIESTLTMPAGVLRPNNALRAAQHFDALDIEDREALERDVFHHNVVKQHRNRLRGGEIEVGVAETADVEARGDAPVRAFNVEARDRTASAVTSPEALKIASTRAWSRISAETATSWRFS